MKKLATLALLCSAVGFSTNAYANSHAGYYCEAAEYEIVNISGTCEKPDYRDAATGQCISKFVGTDYLNVSEQDDGNINFSLFLVYDGGSSCGIENETAKKIDDNTWLFEKELDPGNSDPSANCSIKISYSEDGIKFESPNENATCKGICGFRGNLRHVVFPMATKDTFNEKQEYKCSHPVIDLDGVHLISK